MALEFNSAVLTVVCPSCSAAPDHKCRELVGPGAVALNMDGIHPDRVLLYTARTDTASVLRLPPRDSAVDHPTHYNTSPSGVECIDVVEHMTFNVGNAVKYLWRAGLKGDRIEDLKKARWYIDREIKKLTRET
jgi:hypothetical protein